MRILNSLITIFMLFVTFVLYAYIFHNKHIHPIGKLANQVDERMHCSKLTTLFNEYKKEHVDARFSDRHIIDADETTGRFDTTYIIKIKDKSLFGKAVLTVDCDKNERVLEYHLDTE